MITIASIKQKIGDSFQFVNNSINQQPKLKTACYYLGIAAIGIAVIGAAGVACSKAFDFGDETENMLHQLEDVKSKTVDLCQDVLFGDLLCKGNLGIPRAQMPQVEGEVLTNYLASQQVKGVDVTHSFMEPSQLIATQSEMNAPKVFDIVKAIVKKGINICTEMPILAARNYVVDGHHRFAACSLAKKMMQVISVDKNITTVLSELKEFPGVIYQGLQHFSK